MECTGMGSRVRGLRAVAVFVAAGAFRRNVYIPVGSASVGFVAPYTGDN
jgi:hypothetical protein